MHARTLPTLLAAIALLSCAPRSSQAESAPGDEGSPAPAAAPTKADFEWSGELAAGGRVEIGNVNGDIEVRPGSGKTVRVRGTKSGKDAAELRIDVDAKNNRVEIRPVYPERRRNFDASVDFVLEVPSGIEVDAHAVNGNIDAKDVGTRLEVSSVNGEIATAGCPDVRGNTVNGAVRVQLPARARRAALEAVNGELEIRMAAGAGAKVQANTLSGEIESDFPLTRSRETVGRHASGTIGDGAAAIELSTVNGGIRIKKT